MAAIILNSVLFVAALISISQGVNFREKSRDAIASSRYMILCHAYLITCVAYILMFLCTNPILKYVCYSVMWFAWIMFLASVVILAAYAVNCSGKLVSLAVSFLYYWGMGLYFVNTMTGSGALHQSGIGFFYLPIQPLQRFLHIILYLVYISTLISIGVYYVSGCKRKREYFLFTLFLGAFLPAVLSTLFEMMFLLFDFAFFPFQQILGIIIILALRKLLYYHRSVELCQEDYKEWLSVDRTDVVLICDDALQVVFVNKRAEIIAHTMREEYVGRKLMDIFLLSKEAETELKNPSNKGTFGVGGVYAQADRKVDFVVRRVLDRYDEIFASIVTVFNMEDTEEENPELPKVEEKFEDDSNSVEMTKGARVLIVNENIIRLNSFERMMQPYQMHVTRAIGGEKAIELVKDNVYDILFLDHRMKKLSGIDTARAIRALQGSYYKKVPIVLCTDEKMDDLYSEFLDAGFNDYLLKPVSAKQLNLVLTRWVWQRFEKQEEKKPVQVNLEEVSSYQELKELLEDSLSFYERKEMILFSFCIKAMKHSCSIIGAQEQEELARETENALLFEDMERMEDTYVELVKKTKELLK